MNNNYHAVLYYHAYLRHHINKDNRKNMKQKIITMTVLYYHAYPRHYDNKGNRET